MAAYETGCTVKWDFNVATGNITDPYGGYTLVNTGGVSTPSYANPNVNDFVYDGTSQYGYTGSSSWACTSKFTLEMAFTWDTSQVNYLFARTVKSSNKQYGWRFYRNSSNALVFESYSAGTLTTIRTSAKTDWVNGREYHIVFDYNSTSGQTSYMWVNGVQLESFTSTAVPYVGTAATTALNRDYYGSGYGKNKWYIFRYYNQVNQGANVASNYAVEAYRWEPRVTMPAVQSNTSANSAQVTVTIVNSLDVAATLATLDTTAAIGPQVTTTVPQTETNQYITLSECVGATASVVSPTPALVIPVTVPTRSNTVSAGSATVSKADAIIPTLATLANVSTNRAPVPAVVIPITIGTLTNTTTCIPTYTAMAIPVTVVTLGSTAADVTPSLTVGALASLTTLSTTSTSIAAIVSQADANIPTLPTLTATAPDVAPSVSLSTYATVSTVGSTSTYIPPTPAIDIPITITPVSSASAEIQPAVATLTPITVLALGATATDIPPTIKIAVSLSPQIVGCTVQAILVTPQISVAFTPETLSSSSDYIPPTTTVCAAILVPPISANSLSISALAVRADCIVPETALTSISSAVYSVVSTPRVTIPITTVALPTVVTEVNAAVPYSAPFIPALGTLANVSSFVQPTAFTGDTITIIVSSLSSGTSAVSAEVSRADAVIPLLTTLAASSPAIVAPSVRLDVILPILSAVSAESVYIAPSATVDCTPPVLTTLGASTKSNSPDLVISVSCTVGTLEEISSYTQQLVDVSAALVTPPVAMFSANGDLTTVSRADCVVPMCPTIGSTVRNLPVTVATEGNTYVVIETLQASIGNVSSTNITHVSRADCGIITSTATAATYTTAEPTPTISASITPGTLITAIDNAAATVATGVSRADSVITATALSLALDVVPPTTSSADSILIHLAPISINTSWVDATVSRADSVTPPLPVIPLNALFSPPDTAVSVSTLVTSTVGVAARSVDLTLGVGVPVMATTVSAEASNGLLDPCISVYTTPPTVGTTIEGVALAAVSITDMAVPTVLPVIATAVVVQPNAYVTSNVVILLDPVGATTNNVVTTTQTHVGRADAILPSAITLGNTSYIPPLAVYQEIHVSLGTLIITTTSNHAAFSIDVVKTLPALVGNSDCVMPELTMLVGAVVSPVTIVSASSVTSTVSRADAALTVIPTLTSSASNIPPILYTTVNRYVTLATLPIITDNGGGPDWTRVSRADSSVVTSTAIASVSPTASPAPSISVTRTPSTLVSTTGNAATTVLTEVSQSDAIVPAVTTVMGSATGLPQTTTRVAVDNTVMAVGAVAGVRVIPDGTYVSQADAYIPAVSTVSAAVPVPPYPIVQYPGGWVSISLLPLDVYSTLVSPNVWSTGPVIVPQTVVSTASVTSPRVRIWVTLYRCFKLVGTLQENRLLKGSLEQIWNLKGSRTPNKVFKGSKITAESLMGSLEDTVSYKGD